MIINVHKYRMIIVITALIAAGSLIMYLLDLENKCENQPQMVEDMTPYGEYLSWDEVDELFPKKTEARVIDLETGWYFSVQRRGGTCHADVQPLTARDTRVMKKIYNGEWSWKRRAVILQLDDGLMIAASMNGMPHGLGNIKGNEFDGHFCIHFKDSITHGSRKVNTAHQLMIWKSAGLLEQQLNSLEAKDTIDVFLTAVDQGEFIIAGKLLDTGSINTLLLLDLANIEDIKAYDISPADENTFQIDIRLTYQDSLTTYDKSLLITIIPINKHWRIESRSLIPLLKGNDGIPSATANAALFEEDWETGSL